jgi:hypothetical protein
MADFYQTIPRSMTEVTWIDLFHISLHHTSMYGETSIYRSGIIRFPGSVVKFLWSLSESYFSYGSRIYCFPGSIVSFSDPRQKR